MGGLGIGAGVAICSAYGPQQTSQISIVRCQVHPSGHACVTSIMP
jgi:hypothetical protein